MSQSQIISAISPISVAPMERRTWIRYGSDLDAVCRATGAMKDAGWTGKVRDVSRGGIGLVARHRFRPGTPLLVELTNAAGTVRRVLAVRVARAKAVIGDSGPCWLMGCEFVQPLSDQEIEELLS